MMSNKKRAFTAIEKKVFVEILKKYKPVVESKKTDGPSLKKKNAAWEEIADEYNACPEAVIQATSQQLRRLWMNLKQRKREAMRNENQKLHAFSDGSFTYNVTIDPLVNESTSDTSMPLEMEMEENDTEPSDLKLNAIKKEPTEPANKQNDNLKTENNPSIIDRESEDRLHRANELHMLEKELLYHKIREAKARADLAILLLNHQIALTSIPTSREDYDQS